MTGISQLTFSLASLWLMVSLAGCQHMGGATSAKDASATLGAGEVQLIQGQLVARPLPDDPRYARMRQPCFFFIKHPKDGSMIPVGMLQPNVYVVVRGEDEEWTDVQLTSGQLGSVLSVNLRPLTRAEDEGARWLEPQPAMEPLTLPQAHSGEGAGRLETSLLEG